MNSTRSVPIAVWWVPLLAVVLTPGLARIAAERPMTARIELAFAMTSVVVVVALVLLAAISHGFRQRMRWSLGVTTITILVVFQWPTLTYVGRVLESRLPIPLLADVVPVFFAVSLLWLAMRIGGEWQFATIAGLGAWLVVVVLVVSVLPYIDRSTPALRGAAPGDGAPDVVVIVLDGYARADMMESDFGFDITPWLGQLEQLDFRIATEAHANHSFTYASIATMLDLDYVYKRGPMTDSQHDTMRNALAGNGGIQDHFREAGYEIAYLENAWNGSYCGNSVDVCIRDGLVERVLWNLGQVTILAPIQKATRPHPFNTVSLEQMESLPDYLASQRTDGVPRLTYAHMILPHHPFLLDAECGRPNTPDRRDLTPGPEAAANRRDLYVEQATCTNTKLLETLQQIIADRPNTVIMITGDHGSGMNGLANQPVEEWSDDAVAERMSVLSAYRLPKCESLVYASITPVNGARAVTSCALGMDMGTLEDASLWSPFNGEGPVTDVSDRLDG